MEPVAAADAGDTTELDIEEIISRGREALRSEGVDA